MKEKIRVVIKIREGEYGRAARFEYPDNEHIHRILTASFVEDLSRYKFHFFKNILVSRQYSEDLNGFLKERAKRAGFDIEFIENKAITQGNI